MIIILSKRCNGGATAPFAARLVGPDRTEAVMGLELAVRLDHQTAVPSWRGSTAVRGFIEKPTERSLTAGNYRLDVVELPKESK